MIRRKLRLPCKSALHMRCVFRYTRASQSLIPVAPQPGILTIQHPEPIDIIMTVNERGYPLASTQEIMMIQETMQVLGLYAGEIDGLAGSRTMAAIRAYKKMNHMAPNNAITEEFIEHLRAEA